VGGARRKALSTVPERIEGANIILRRWTPADAPLLLAAISASLPALRQWTPWVIPDPLEVSVLEERLAKFHAQFDASESFIYGIFDARETSVLGQAGLYARIGPGALEVGYFLRSDATGRGIATQATRLLIDVAFRFCEVTRVEARCEPGNHASIAIPRRLGFTLREVLEKGDALGAHPLEIWEMFSASRLSS
jgi:RimJ/RimL family protein N-acetyltransferase